MTREDFLREAAAVYLDGGLGDVSAEWVQEAWDADEADPERSLRLYITGDVWHEANKGCLPLIAGQLRWLGQVLRYDQWDDLYRDLREQEPHREAEIRQEFLAAAPDKTRYLPPPLTRDEVVELLGSGEAARMLEAFEDERPQQ